MQCSKYGKGVLVVTLPSVGLSHLLEGGLCVVLFVYTVCIDPHYCIVLKPAKPNSTVIRLP